MKKVILTLAAIATLSGCATQTFLVNAPNNHAKATPTTEDMQSFFVSGIGQEQTINAAEVCGGMDKVAKVETQLTFLDGFLGGISWGIYTPRTAKVYCSK